MRELNEFEMKAIENKINAKIKEIRFFKKMGGIKINGSIRYKDMILYFDNLIYSIKNDKIGILVNILQEEIEKIEKIYKKPYSVRMFKYVDTALENKNQLTEQQTGLMNVYIFLGETNYKNGIRNHISRYLIKNEKATFKEVYNYTLETFEAHMIEKFKDFA